MPMKKTAIFRISRLVKPLFQLLYPVKVQGLENLPKEGAAIICSNHISTKDPIYLSMHSKRMMRYMAKKELFQNKLASIIITGMGAFPVDRGAGDGKATDYASYVLEQGEMVAIFIEGTRSKDGSLGRPRSGAAMLAFQNKVPMVPVCITTKNLQAPKMFQKSVISYGKPIPYAELGLHEGSGTEFRNASRKVMDAIKDLRERDLPIANGL